MIIKGKNGFGNDRMRWVILLFAVAVILPTVCLLWFMTQAVRNERLAIKEKLVSVYDNSLKTSLEKTLDFNRITTYLALAFSADGFLIFDSNDNFIFPVGDTNDIIISEDVFTTAYELEYANENPLDALGEYNKITETTEDDILRIKALIASARCLKKINQIDKAIERLHEVIYKYPDNTSNLITHKIRAWLLLFELLEQENSDKYINELSAMYDYAADNIDTDNDLVLMGLEDYEGKYIPTSLQVLALEKFVKYAENIKRDSNISQKIRRASQMLPILRMSLQMSNIFKNTSYISNTDSFNSPVFRLDTTEQLYGHYQQVGSRKYLKIYYQPTVESWFKPYFNDMINLSSQCAVYDEKGDLAAGTDITNSDAFIDKELNSGYFPEWTTKVFIHSSAFKNAANKQVAIYIWAGVLVIVLILTTGGFAGRSIGRQMKMNRLKNDFIATVTHELKTPLASMRVLADTLLEGNYNDQKQEKEYLQLICKENKRLTSLIDNFLTFSRMERNKRAFDMVQENPAEIAQAAVEAVKTKIADSRCKSEIHIDKDLPNVQADHDAMVTVLVNLLDNACKYSYDNKHIQLTVFSEDNCVCFSVKDNGIGMTRRQIRKIFNRFYQVDSTLSRRTEGTGLGLSIVKFIVDAHKGKITVESKVGQGSTFTVMLPHGR